jgi:DNA-binding NtrC family response regulator
MAQEQTGPAGRLSDNIRHLMLRAKRVLLVDDDASFCELLKTVADTNFVCEVVPVQTVSAARKKLDSGEEFDAAILDARVTNGNGIKLFCEMKARFASIPVVFLTGYDGPEFRREVEAVGPAPVFSKPSAMRVDFLDQLLSQFGIRRRVPV